MEYRVVLLSVVRSWNGCGDCEVQCVLGVWLF